MRIKLLFLFCLAVCINNSQAKTFIWKAEKDGQHLYIGGTIHVLRPQDKPLPEAYYKTYQNSDVLVTEVDVKEMAGAAFSMSMRAMYQDGTTIKKVLSPEVFTQLQSFCVENKLPLDAYMNMKPPMISVSIAMSMMLKHGASPEGIDLIFSQKAMAEGKKRLALETVQEQLDALFNEKVNPDEIILSTIRDAENVGKMLDQMIAALYQGKTEIFSSQFLQPMKQDTPEFYKSLIEVRNNNWVPKIEKMLSTPEVEFILVGGLHLVDDIGVIKQLKAKGIIITQLD
ncbi:MAG: TraB/GumN family protein [Gammaproteobacteria bacterium]|nr:TraB/GumN family protein [Gammaproteobacteria bacterium]